jgi:hypothetical protein
MTRRIAWFVTPHGFGHAARSCAVMQALREIDPNFEFDIYTTVPEWFMAFTLGSHFAYHAVQVDVGLIQNDPFSEDLPATVSRLSQFLPFDDTTLDHLGNELCSTWDELVVCDISPLGIAAARHAGIPSILVENFTWDWIYQGYLAQEPGLAPFIETIAGINSQTTCHLQIAPVCNPIPRVTPLPLASRKPRKPRELTRQELGIDPEKPAVLLSFGGIPMTLREFDGLEQHSEIAFILPTDVPAMRRIGSCILLPFHSQFYHPDLVAASDAVVGKVGYSTLAETYHAGVPFGYLGRAGFRESPVMEAFAREHMPGFEIGLEEIKSGAWIERLPDLVAIPPAGPQENGANVIAKKILEVCR